VALWVVENHCTSAGVFVAKQIGALAFRGN
jgi:hypothetical protein